MSKLMYETLVSTNQTMAPHYIRHKANVVCCNCGGLGHVYARCNHPVTSYGVICYRIVYNDQENTLAPEYLMVQRKDSLSYVEFMRGKYDLQNISYMMSLFTNMTEDERQSVLREDFDTLWTTLWSSNSKNFVKEYNQSKDKFRKLKEGYLLKTVNSDVIQVSLTYLYQNTKSNKIETEWGFPKGRRSYSEEDDKRCALREFKEETCINMNSVRLNRDIKPFEEVFTGSNKVRYKHVYYIARFSSFPSEAYEGFVDPENKHQAREIKDVKWFTFDEAQAKIGDNNIERRELLKRVNNLIVKSYCGAPKLF